MQKVHIVYKNIQNIKIFGGLNNTKFNILQHALLIIKYKYFSQTAYLYSSFAHLYLIRATVSPTPIPTARATEGNRVVTGTGEHQRDIDRSSFHITFPRSVLLFAVFWMCRDSETVASLFNILASVSVVYFFW